MREKVISCREGKKVFIFKKMIHRLIPELHMTVFTMKKVSNFSFLVGEEEYQLLTWILLP